VMIGGPNFSRIGAELIETARKSLYLRKVN
jgi:hypothetical protein